MVGKREGQTLVAEILIAAGTNRATEAASLLITEFAINGAKQSRSQFVELWAKPTSDGVDAAADGAGLRPYRGLYQMRRSLPVDLEPLATRAYRPSDAERLREVNNRSFAAHPSQGEQSPEEWSDTIQASWFRPEGTRILEDDGGQIVGFCITKIHPDQGLGEIYVIGLDPSAHGQGLGAPLTAAGLDWLHAQGLTTAMLYVEDDNVPAIRTYQRLGFETIRHDRAWRG